MCLSSGGVGKQVIELCLDISDLGKSARPFANRRMDQLSQCLSQTADDTMSHGRDTTCGTFVVRAPMRRATSSA